MTDMNKEFKPCETKKCTVDNLHPNWRNQELADNMKEVKFTKPQRDEISFQVYVRIDTFYPDSMYTIGISCERDENAGEVWHEFENSEQDMVKLARALDLNTRNVFTDMEIEYMIHIVEIAIEPLYGNECWGGVRSLNNALKKMGYDHH